MEPTGFMFHSLSIHLAKSIKIENVEVVCGFPNFPHGKFINRKWYALFSKKIEKNVNIYNVMVIPSDNTSNTKRIMNYTSYLVTSTLRGIFSKSPDIVVASSPPIFTALAGLIVAKLKRAKFVLDIRDIWPESAVQMGSIKNVKIIKFLEWLEILLYKNSDLITVATPGMVEMVRLKVPGKLLQVEYIPCGVSIPAENLTAAVGENPFEKGDHDKFCVLYAGLHGHAQKLTTIIEAASVLRDRSDIVFYFVGAGPDKNQVVKYASDLNLSNVKFLDPVSREVIRRYYAFAGCGIVPLRDLKIFKNVFPSKTFELMSYGVPSIVGVGGEIAKVIDASKAGQSVMAENAEQYALAIERYASDPEYRLEIKHNAYEAAKQSFDYKVINQKFEDMLVNIHEEKVIKRS
jgi:glycosyltransferase involved in cell wall biosynthesis